MNVGSRGNLILAFYEPGSLFDNAVTQWLQEKILTCQGTAEFEDISTETIGSIGAGSCTDTEVEFWDSLSDIEDLKGLQVASDLANPVNHASQKCGEACSGNDGSCATSDGTRSIAETSQGNETRYFTGTCKPSHYAVDLNKGSEVLVDGQDSGYPAANASSRIIQAIGTTTLIPAACPCNCSYVSQGCCNAPSGVVYEAPRLKLGKLGPEQCTEGSINAS